ncbi:MAG TPA: glycosyltransferase family 4 protein [Chthoniobacteraceae bacterium]|jgi:glycosyltransferase involved in cell wall biosynthesis|nr:glycosyltransferase family 4 protein [Chthoniobacteraceae bacterium]
MKIVFLTPGTGSYYCGVCMRDNAIAREMIRQGHEALLVPMYLPLTLDEQSASTNLPVFYGGISVYLKQKFAFFRATPRWLDKLLNARGFLRLAGRQAGMTGGQDLGPITISMLRGEDGNQARELEDLVRWVAQERPDVVWLSTALLAGLARRIKHELDIPVFCSLQGEDTFLDELTEPSRTEAWKTLADRARDLECVVAPSAWYAELMGRRMQLAPEQLRIIPNAINLEGYAPGEPEQPPVIGFLARFIPGKGLGLVVDAFLELKRRGRFPQTRLRCIGAMTAGDERYVQTLQKKIAAAGLTADVEFRPNVSREEKIAGLQTLTLLTTPTTYGESFGLYLIEAMAAGVPVVQPRTAAFTEIVEQTGGGLLFDEITPPALADAWESLLADPARARELGRRGRASVESDYSIERLASNLLALAREKTAHSIGPIGHMSPIGPISAPAA